ncbi:hypothetical protein BCN_1804 [Bacillus cereus NC7401]|nr:hypothetical protein BCN_1804 [Bacillus cereus NC7401]
MFISSFKRKREYKLKYSCCYIFFLDCMYCLHLHCFLSKYAIKTTCPNSFENNHCFILE